MEMELLKFIDNLRKRSTYARIVDDTTYETLFEGTLTELSHSVWFTKNLHKKIADVRLDDNPILYWIYIEV